MKRRKIRMRSGGVVTQNGDEQDEPHREPSNNKPTIPKDVLMEFVDQNLAPEQAKWTSRVTAGFCWDVKGIERYRINVWASKPVEESLIDRNYISASFHVHYNPKTKQITDKTIKPKPKKKNIFQDP